MLFVERIAKIRLAHFSRKMTIKAICRDLRVSRKVVRGKCWAPIGTTPQWARRPTASRSPSGR
jgi:hypothetical protein